MGVFIRHVNLFSTGFEMYGFEIIFLLYFVLNMFSILLNEIKHWIFMEQAVKTQRGSISINIRLKYLDRK